MLRVAEVNRGVRLQLEADWDDLWVEGELSDVTRAASGHYYFTLNDPKEPAQLRGVMFRSDAKRAQAEIKPGTAVRMRGKLSLYEARGSFQFLARAAMPVGQGDLQAQFERLKKKLAAEGLFETARKRPLPRFPTTVGVVTSAKGAALHDIIKVICARFPVRIVVADCRVQGKEAPPTIVSAIHRITTLVEPDVLIVGRGGGSAEDLWAFNDEEVVRAIASCPIPTVSAVGHEVDVTLADLAADVRAATPSNAGEMVVVERESLRRELQHQSRRAEQTLDATLNTLRLQWSRLGQALSDPRSAIRPARLQLASLQQALSQAQRQKLRTLRSRFNHQREHLAQKDVRLALRKRRPQFVAQQTRLIHLTQRQLQENRGQLESTAGRLQALSPLSVLSRGYSIVLHQGRALTDSKIAKPGDPIHLKLHQGEITATVNGPGPVPKTKAKKPTSRPAAKADQAQLDFIKTGKP